MEMTKLEGIVIDEKPYGESSKILNIITKDKGLIGVISKGSKNLKSPLRSISERFTYANFIVSYKEGKLSTLISADIINPLVNIKKDITKVSYLNFLSELTMGVLKHTSDDRIYDIYLNAVLKIEEGFDPSVICNIIELKYLTFLGAKPKLDGCVVCGKSSVVTISAYKGGFVCKEHAFDEHIVSDKTIKLIRLLEYVDISKISKLDVSDEVKQEINMFLDEYYDRYTGLYLKSKKFLKTLEKL